mmetsp:Transcript_26321/g.72327  ORF Transcript_26321/g.72327 Transcript_26321/m.72327 type:complete len:484 (+) Transcript_26321:747-2198(+)
MPVYICQAGANSSEPWRHGLQVYASPFALADTPSGDSRDGHDETASVAAPRLVPTSTEVAARMAAADNHADLNFNRNLPVPQQLQPRLDHRVAGGPMVVPGANANANANVHLAGQQQQQQQQQMPLDGAGNHAFHTTSNDQQQQEEQQQQQQHITSLKFGLPVRRIRHAEVVLVDDVCIAYDRHWLRLRWSGSKGGFAGYVALGKVNETVFSRHMMDALQLRETGKLSADETERDDAGGASESGVGPESDMGMGIHPPQSRDSSPPVDAEEEEEEEDGEEEEEDEVSYEDGDEEGEEDGDDDDDDDEDDDDDDDDDEDEDDSNDDNDNDNDDGDEEESAGTANLVDARKPQQVLGLPKTLDNKSMKVERISCGSHHTAMLMEDGSIFGVGIASDEPVPLLDPVELIPSGVLDLPIRHFEAHHDRTTVIDNKGMVYQVHLWNDETLRDYAYFTPSYVDSLLDQGHSIRSIHRGWRHTIIVTEDN